MAQTTLKNVEQEFVYSKEWRFGVKLHTHGYGLSLAKSKIINRSKKKFWEIEILEIKHAKQSRQLSRLSDRTGNARSYQYGKQNNFYNINLNFGRHKVIAETGRKNGVEVSITYSLGASLGILKPYYLLVKGFDNNSVNIRYSSDEEDYTADLFLNETRIYSGSSFVYGLNEIQPVPGAQGKFSFLFDWANTGETIKALEVGAMVNAYYKRVPIMIEADNNLIFTNLFIKLVFGRRSID